MRVPLPPPNSVSRPRLLATLRAGAARKLTIVIAPAGFGKTTLVAEYARELDGDAAWLSLDPSDNDIAVFAQYLVAAIAQVRPGFGQALRAWLAATPTPATQVEDLAALLLADLEDADGERLVLFLDDFQEVGESESITRLIDLIVRYLPPHAHVVISARVAPAITATRLIVQQQITGLGADALRFTPEEGASWLAGRPALADPANAEQILARAEGWITGLILQAAAGAPAAPGATPEQLYTYLSTEVLEQQPPDVRRFLLRASVLTHLTAAVCEATLEVERAADTLKAIHERQLFLTAVGAGDPPQYRFHPLFRSFLAARLRAADPAEFARLHARAAAYYEQHGNHGQAMEHLLSAHDWEQAAALAVRVGSSELEAGRAERVERWIGAFPATERDRRPALLLLETRLLAAQSHYDAAAEVLTRAERELLATEDRQGYAEALSLRAQLTAGRGDGALMVEIAQQALAIEEATPTTRAHARHAMAIGYSLAGEAAEADAAFAAALDAYQALGDVQSTAHVTSDWAYGLVLREEFTPALAQLASALEYARQARNTRLQALVLSNLALVHAASGNLLLAEDQLAAALEIARELRWRRVECEILLGRAENALTLQGAKAALALYEEAAALARPGAVAALVTALAGQARCLRWMGRYPDAVRVGRQGLDTALTNGMADGAALCRLELGAALLVTAPEDALALLEEAAAALAPLGSKHAAARAATVLATGRFANSDFAGAGEALDRAYDLASARGSDATLAPELATVYGLPLVRRALRTNRRYGDLLDTISARLESEHGAAPVPPPASGATLQIVQGRPRVIEVYSLGAAAVFRDGTPIVRADWQTATAKELFFYLVEHGDGRRRDVIQAALWPDQTASRATDNFHTSLKRLRAALGVEVVRMEDNIYRLHSALALWHDGTEAIALIERARAAGAAPAARRWWSAAADLIKGPFADEFFRDWAGARRQFWESRAKEALSWLADDSMRNGSPQEAIAWGQRLLELDPLDESVHVLLMRIYASAGHTAMLIRQYNELTRVLRYELDAEPTPATLDLYHRLLKAMVPPA